MSQYKVLRSIEHDQVLYVPQGATEAVKAKSAGCGGEIPVNASGTIELDPAAAEALTGGQIALIAVSGAGAPAGKRASR